LPLNEEELAAFESYRSLCEDPENFWSTNPKQFGNEIMDVDGLALRRLDPQYMTNSGLLTDDVVNFYLALIAERENAGGKTKVLAQSTEFWRRLTRNGYDFLTVAGWSGQKGASGLQIMDLDYMLIPIDSFSHCWKLGVINFKKKRFEYWDYENWSEDSDRRNFCMTVSTPVYACNVAWQRLISNST
jgi:Ulp1 family protease